MNSLPPLRVKEFAFQSARAGSRPFLAGRLKGSSVASGLTLDLARTLLASTAITSHLLERHWRYAGSLEEVYQEAERGQALLIPELRAVAASAGVTMEREQVAGVLEQLVGLLRAAEQDYHTWERQVARAEAMGEGEIGALRPVDLEGALGCPEMSLRLRAASQLERVVSARTQPVPQAAPVLVGVGRGSAVAVWSTTG